MVNHLKKCAKITSYLLLFCAITGLILYFGKDIFIQFKSIAPLFILISIVLQIPMIASGGLAFKILCTSLDISMRFKDWVGLSFIANFLNQLLPYRPGVGFRYLYMRQHYHMKAVQFVHVMFIYFLLTMLSSCAFTLIGWFNSKITTNYYTHILSACGFFIAILLCIFFLRFLFSHNRPSHSGFIEKLTVALNTLLNNPGALISATLSLLTLNALTAIIFYLIFLSLGNPLPFADCIFIVGIVILSMIIPITPGNIGVLESIVGTLTQMLYQDFSLGFSATALFRVSQWIPSVLLGTCFSLVLAGSLLPKFSQYKLGPRQSVD